MLRPVEGRPRRAQVAALAAAKGVRPEAAADRRTRMRHRPSVLPGCAPRRPIGVRSSLCAYRPLALSRAQRRVRSRHTRLSWPATAKHACRGRCGWCVWCGGCRFCRPLPQAVESELLAVQAGVHGRRAPRTPTHTHPNSAARAHTLPRALALQPPRGGWQPSAGGFGRASFWLWAGVSVAAASGARTDLACPGSARSGERRRLLSRAHGRRHAPRRIMRRASGRARPPHSPRTTRRWGCGRRVARPSLSTRRRLS
eukprot:6443718-Prymnesium_polylepis.1